MRPGWALLILATLLHVCVASASAQTLTEQLSAEDPTKLVEQALRGGNIVRGAILFHQGNINCAKCHRPATGKDRIGPDLSRMDQKTTNESIVESILNPSAKIKEGFEPVLALTNDGKTFSGIIVSQTDDKIVIRDKQDIDKVTTIARADLDELEPGKKSTMPDSLADELKDRRQFLDLLRYVIDLKTRGPDQNSITKTVASRRMLTEELNGLILIQNLNCTACHQSESIQSPVAAKQPPRLKWSAKWINPEYIQNFIAHPHKTKPGTTMPDVLANSDEATRNDSAKALTHFLISQTEKAEATGFTSEPEASSRGFKLFHSVGCVACHSPRNEKSIEEPLADSTPLGNLASKYNIAGLTNFLEDPLAVRRSGHMPNMTLTHRESIDIANFLLQNDSSKISQWKPDPELAKKGETLFAKQNCANCHSETTELTTKPVATTPLEKLNLKNGCLSDQSGQWPNFHLKPDDRQAIQTALENQPIQLTATQKIEMTLTSFNCIACHDRGDLGGIATERNPHFQTTNMNLGEQGRIPPTLSGVGAKLKQKWMRDVLVNQRKTRPYMKTRMPQFGESNIGHLLELFESSDQNLKTEPVEFKDQKAMRQKGHLLAGNKGLNCVACHTYQYKLSDTMPAVDLTEMSERLKKDWFHQYMLNPQRFSPNTVMPSFWPGGKAIRKDIEGTPEENVEALWQYLIDGRQARAPSGIVREPLEIVVKEEAQMLRRSYQGIGKRGIGVGYPGGINIAYDAEQMRLASIWRGKFVDPVGVWTGQGHGTVRPMSRPINLAKGPELDSQKDPWVVDDGRPPKHQFKGYTLDKIRRPTFRYEFGLLKIEDTFSELKTETKDKTNLRRRVIIQSPDASEQLRFRIASDKKISENADGTFSIGDQFKIRITSNHKAERKEDLLEVPLKPTPNSQAEIIIEYLINP